VFNDKRQSTGVRMLVPGPEFIRIEDAPPAEAWSMPLSPVASVGQFNPEGDIERRVRVQGTVIAVEASRTVYVADGDASIAIYSEGGCRAVPGNLLDSAGFPAVINERPGLADAICRNAGTGVRIVAERVNPETILRRWIGPRRGAIRLRSLRGMTSTSEDGGHGVVFLAQRGWQHDGDRAGKQDFTASLPGRQGRSCRSEVWSG